MPKLLFRSRLKTLAAPQSGFGEQHFHGYLFKMASAYLFHLVQNHPFLEGSKRVETAAALTLLELNGMETKIPNHALVATALAVAQEGTAKSASRNFSAPTLNHSRHRHQLSFHPPPLRQRALSLYQTRQLHHPQQPWSQCTGNVLFMSVVGYFDVADITFSLFRRPRELVWIGIGQSCLGSLAVEMAGHDGFRLVWWVARSWLAIGKPISGMILPESTMLIPLVVSQITMRRAFCLGVLGDGKGI